ncbi:MAG: gas vesicle protein [Deltaproteobacteria bacterium]|nr:gas vesicle protein [Deltaproteobacteria bacterium]
MPNIGNIITMARNEISGITGLKPSSTIKTAKDEKGWHIFVELIEKHSIPDGMDILATYEVVVDDDGNLLEFNRRGMRKRMDTLVTEW